MAEPGQIRIIGRGSCVVTKPQALLGDVAAVSGTDPADDEAVILLSKIVLLRSLKPGSELKLAGADVITRLQENGVDLGKVKYTLPETILVHRPGRPLEADEVRAAISEYLATTQGKWSLKDVDLSTQLFVPPGTSKLEARLESVVGLGKAVFDIKADVDGAEPQLFKVEARVEEFKDVPIAKAPLLRGAILGQEDFVMARLNTTAIPKDAILDGATIIGLRTSQNLGSGEVFRRDKLEIPPLIKANSKVLMLYQAGALKVTASGMALQDGIEGQVIKVRNERSKKLIEGRILKDGTVGVVQ